MADTADELWREGLRAGRRRDYVAALRCFRECEAQGRVDAWLMIGRSYLALRLYEDALLAFSTHLARFPDDATAYFHLGRALLGVRQYGSAAQSFQTAQRLGWDHPQLEVFQGWAYLKARRPNLARRLLERAVLRNPDHRGIYQLYLNSILVWGIAAFRREQFDLSAQAMRFLTENGHREFLVRLYLAAGLRETGELPEAYRLYRGLHAEAPEDLSLLLNLWELAHRLGMPDEAERWAEAIRARHPGYSLPPLDGLFPSLARTLFAQEKFPQAIHYALKVLRVDRNAEMHALIGRAYGRLGNTTKAINHLRQALKLHPAEDLRLDLLRLLVQTARWEEARHEVRLLQREFPACRMIGYFKPLVEARLRVEGVDHVLALSHALREHPSDPALCAVLAGVLLDRGQTEEAQRWLTTALDRDPRNDEALELYLGISAPPPDEATLALCRRSRKRPHPGLNRTYARLLLSRGQAAEARSAVLENLRLDPESDQDWEILAEAERVLQNFTAAYAIWVRQLRRDPQNRKAILHLFYLLHRMGRADRAEQLKFQTIQRLKDWNLHYSFAKAYEKLGMVEKALLEYQEHLALFPNHPQSRRDFEELRRRTGGLG